MSRRDDNQAAATSDEVDMHKRDRSSSSSSGSAKDDVVARIKHNFYLETRAFRKRILDATDEASRARERVDSFQDELLLAKRKCHKLKKLLQERDATIEFLTEQRDVALPMLVSETLRGIHAHMDNQLSDDARSDDAPLSVSRTRELAAREAAVDARVHEYETQIAQLYTEIQDAKQQNDMLSTCLREQKHARAKLLRACKRTKLELDALKSNGMAQLLDDLQTKCQALEAERDCVQRDLDATSTHLVESQQRCARVTLELEQLREAQSHWADTVQQREHDLVQCRAQIRAQQEAIEDLQLDLTHRSSRRSSFGDRNDNDGSSDDTRDERDLLVRALHTERSRLKDAEQTINELRIKTAALERSALCSPAAITATAATPAVLMTGDDSALQAEAAPTAASSAELRELREMARQVNAKALVLRRLVQSCIESDMIDLQLLADESWRGESVSEDESMRLLALTESAERGLRRELLLAKRSLIELQQLVEDACATAMGSSCALQ